MHIDDFKKGWMNIDDFKKELNAASLNNGLAGTLCKTRLMQQMHTEWPQYQEHPVARH